MEKELTPKEKAIRWYWEKQGIPEINANVSFSMIAQNSDLGIALDIALKEQFNDIFTYLESVIQGKQLDYQEYTKKVKEKIGATLR